jgi:hypothetical protein
MTGTKDRVSSATESVKPYVARAMSDEKLREDVLSAFATARELYDQISRSNRPAVTLAQRVATDDELREKVRAAVEDLRNASDRLQGRSEHQARNTTLLVAGLALGILFNPITGADTRRWLKDVLTGGGDDFDGDFTPSDSNGTTA